NLLANRIQAMKDMDAGGGLKHKSERGKKRQLKISISDTGMRLEPEQASESINAFVTSKPEATGMELAISGSIVESHGGRRGATFQFTLPSEASAHQVA